MKHHALLYIGSESYDGATITVLQGLQELGFTVYVYKPNVNSWFCETLIPETHLPQVDFVLSNLHWGTRWSRYNTIPRGIPRVLIDGDDDYWGKGWRFKFKQYWNRYRHDAPESVKMQYPCPYRWMEPLGDYEPDVLFVTNKHEDAFYLPFGIQREYMEMGKNAITAHRSLDLIHFPGSGKARKRVHEMIDQGLVPGITVSRQARSTPQYPPGLQVRGRTASSHRRWGQDPAYYDALKRAKALIYPAIDGPQWDSKRPYEALACGCMLVMQTPRCDQSDYPLDDLGVYFNGPEDLPMVCNLLLADGIELARRRAWLASEKFTPVPIARYFLEKICSTT